MSRTIIQKTSHAILICFSIFVASCSNHLKPSVDDVEIGSNSTISTALPDFSVPDGWVVYAKPKPLSREIYCANLAIKGNEWKVGSQNGQLLISNYSAYNELEQSAKLPANLKKILLNNMSNGVGMHGYLHIEQFANGWLIGSDDGEWGGKLYWLSNEGEQAIELLKDNIRGIISSGDTAFILAGLAHLTIDEGMIYKVSARRDGKLQSEVILDLKAQPQSFVVANNSVFILLNDKLLRLEPNGQTSVLAESDYQLLYPNSMAITSSGVIYVGMRLFLVRFVPDGDGFREEWLVRQDCTKFAEKEFECVCKKVAKT